MRSATVFCLFLVTVLQSCCNGSDESPLVRVKQGQIRGHTDHSQNGKMFFGFKGLPYAEPPTGELRFKRPLPHHGWTGTLEANNYGSPCQQYDSLMATQVIGDENCLFINVFTPQLPTSSDGPELPVMVFIHGGGYIVGSADLYGPHRLLDHDVVYVSLNYRLGIFGFLSTEDASSAGNYGLYDQTLALRWVRDNIRAFGGDPESVTIFGESAGAGSVSYHILSPHSKGLFHKAICQSGAAFCPWGFQRHPLTNAKIVAEGVGCSSRSSTDLVECLRKVDSRKLVEAESVLYMFGDPLNRMPYGPTIEKGVEDGFLLEDPQTILESGKFNKVPAIYGITNSEWEVKAAIKREVEQYVANFDVMGDLLYLRHLPQGGAAAISKLRNYYFKDGKVDMNAWKSFSHMMSDGMMNHCTIRGAQLHAAHAPVYFYVWNHPGEHTLLASFMKGVDTSKDLGVCHGDDLMYFFSCPFFPPLNDADEAIAVKATQMWADFARSSNPTPDATWEPLTPHGSLHFLSVQMTPEMKSGFAEERMRFWDELDVRQSKIKDEL